MERVDAIEKLISYSPVEIFTILICAILVLKFFWSLIEWFMDHTKKALNIMSDKEKNEKEFRDTILDMAKKIDDKEVQFTDAVLTVEAMIDELKARIKALEEKEHLTQERIQEDSRAYLIDQHRRYMSAGWIDTHSKENMEIRYMYYKAAGGNTFVDELMAEIRALPQTPLKIAETEV